jgi:hypothetical protein
MTSLSYSSRSTQPALLPLALPLVLSSPLWDLSTEAICETVLFDGAKNLKMEESLDEEVDEERAGFIGGRCRGSEGGCSEKDLRNETSVGTEE